MKYHAELMKKIIHMHFIKQVHQYVSWSTQQLLHLKSIKKLYLALITNSTINLVWHFRKLGAPVQEKRN